MKKVFAILFCVLITASAFAKEKSMKIKIDITSGSGNHTIAATLADNSSAAAFYTMM